MREQMFDKSACFMILKGYHIDKNDKKPRPQRGHGFYILKWILVNQYVGNMISSTFINIKY